MYYVRKIPCILRVKRKEKVQIQCKLESTDDLLTLLKTHPYEESKTYNIDLKSLHKIETELQSLHNMVGMKTLK